MKVINKEIEVLAHFDFGTLKPLRLKYKNKNDYKVLRIHIISSYKERLAGNHMIVYKCDSIINNEKKIYELKFELDTCKWYLFKI